MRFQDENLTLTPSDLSNHLSCPHLTSLNVARAMRRIPKPRYEKELEALRERGIQHEADYLDHLRASGRQIVELDESDSPKSGHAKTRDAMRGGAEVISQAHLVSGRWRGRADFLVKVDTPSDLGAWSYEVQDTKLAQVTKGGNLLQLSLYADIVAEIQDLAPEHVCVVRPWTDYVPDVYRVADFSAYYRRVRTQLETAVQEAEASIATYPEPCDHCDICDWSNECKVQRKKDDHLSLVAGISRLQRRELTDRGIETVKDLSDMPLPISFKPLRGSADGLSRVREQARIQVEGREANQNRHELLEFQEGRGFGLLPEPSLGDVFFDLEGDPFVGRGGREYLFGWSWLDSLPRDESRSEVRYKAEWCLSEEDEKQVFGAFIDEMMERQDRHPDFHIYHYAPYEKAAVRRLMGRYSTRETEVDKLLRAERFVDLYAVSRQAIRASVEKYSIKDLEPFFDFERETDLKLAGDQRHALQIELERGNIDGITPEMYETVQNYNRDDCVATWGLRNWLERIRGKAIDNGANIPRPEVQDEEASESVTEEEATVNALRERLISGVSLEEEGRGPEQNALWMLAELLGFHRREDKAVWWEFFRLRDSTDEEMLDERQAVAGLVLVDDTGKIKKSPLHTYSFPAQETSVRVGDKLRTSLLDKANYGEVSFIDPVGHKIGVKKTQNTKDLHAETVFLHDFFPKPAQKASLLKLGEWAASNGMDAPGEWQAGRDLLMRTPPRLRQGEVDSLKQDDETTLDAARRLSLQLDGGVLPIQGPPGSGKTYTGARMVLELVRSGRKVGITAVGHIVIRNLLSEVLAAADEAGETVNCVHKIGGDSTVVLKKPPLVETKSNGAVEEGLATGAFDVGAGTAWLWSRPECEGLLDVLVVDEAGQMSLADVLAVSGCARNLILLGDPQQLEQPQQGSHPEGADVSALEHILGGEKTIPPDRGLFLEQTWRLHPDVCSFTSALFYDGRLESHAGLENQAILGSGRLVGSGLRFEPVAHLGCVNRSPEEIAKIDDLVSKLVAMEWRDERGTEKDLGVEDILIVAPYNAQVAALSERLPAGARVGTVDRFQGQEAPIVIYSMTTSDPEDAPRGMGFLYSLSRLNVATSRARCLVLLVGNPDLLEVECRTPEQMRLANAFCAYVERAV